jgi:integrase
VWFESLVGKAASTIKGYRVARDWWKAKIGAKPGARARAQRHPHGAGQRAGLDRQDPQQQDERAARRHRAGDRGRRPAARPHGGHRLFEHQDPEPDPFDQDEAEAIIAGWPRTTTSRSRGTSALKFYTGTRTSESLALRWPMVDWRRHTMAVGEGSCWASTRTRRRRTRRGTCS